MGGGIFLGPLLILAGWGDARETSGASAAFNVVNSVAGLAGRPVSLGALPSAFPVWLLAAMLGGLVGSELGSRRAKSATLRRLLAMVLILAGARQMAGLERAPARISMAWSSVSGLASATPCHAVRSLKSDEDSG
jgi:uncharacterized membrane protein YfcA